MLYASHAFRWINCPASARPPAFVSSIDNETRLDGLAAHWCAAAVLTGGASDPIELIGRVSPDGIEITPEIASCVRVYTDYVLPRVDNAIIEEKFDILDMISVKPDCIIRGDNYLEVIEFKYGWKIVEPEYNPQLMIGAASQIPSTQIKLTVIQPRPAHHRGMIRHHVITPEILEYNITYILERAILTQKQWPPVRPHVFPKCYCDNCPHASNCSAISHEIYSAQDRQSGFSKIDAKDLTRELVFLRTCASQTKARLNALESEIEARMRSGEYIPGLFMKPRYGNRTFTVNADMVKAISGTEPYKKVKISPAELEKEGVSRTIIDEISASPFIGTKLELLTQKEVEKIFNGK
jgi:hypothetical protein